MNVIGTSAKEGCRATSHSDTPSLVKRVKCTAFAIYCNAGGKRRRGMCKRLGLRSFPRGKHIVLTLQVPDLSSKFLFCRAFQQSSKSLLHISCLPHCLCVLLVLPYHVVGHKTQRTGVPSFPFCPVTDFTCIYERPAISYLDKQLTCCWLVIFIQPGNT